MNNYRILIIDDFVDNLKAIVSIFQKHEPDYHTLQTNSPQKALDIASQTLPDLIICDWEMPELSGIDFIYRLKNNEITKDIPVIMATAVMLNTNHLKMALDAGAIDYIRKPVEPVELIARTKAALLITSYYKELINNHKQKLTENTLSLIKNQRLFSDFSRKLESLVLLIEKEPQKVGEKLLKLSGELKGMNEKEIWKKFKLSFSNVHANFTRNLTKTHPLLTPSDVKLCSFIILGMANKEIASLMNCSPNSIKVARYRLRKKIDLEKGTNLENYLSQF
ncbi:MAG: response regulator [Bacteroidales bacterium]|nr:response regulator [Bacteroidales bacterium]